MKITVDIKPYELEPDDTIAGMPARALVAFAATVRKAGITDGDLKDFIHNMDSLSEVLKKEYDEILKDAVCHSFSGTRFWDGKL